MQGRVEQAEPVVPPFLQARLLFSEKQATRQPAYPGSAWRGALGHVLRQRFCATGMRECRCCAVRYDCLYATQFETLPRPNGRGINTHAPHPYVLYPEPAQQGDGAVRHALNLTLVGRAMALLPVYMKALEEAASRGVAGKRLRLIDAECTVRHASDVASEAFPPPPAQEQVQIRFITPLRIKHDNDIVRDEELTPHVFLLALARRIAQLDFHHGSGRDVTRLLPAGLPDRFEQKDLHWVHLDRYSSRQQTKHEMNGVVGEAEVRLPQLATLWPLLWAGQYLHVGKLATMGLGGYRVVE